MNAQKLFYAAKQVVENEPEKFFMNIHEYDGVRYAMFDYALTIPSHFNTSAAFECRGSVFEVNDNNDFVRIACRPYEKFLNLHEYDYLNNEGLFDGVKEKYGINVNGSEDIKTLDIAYALNKEDGSIISTFLHKGEMDMKSNSSLTSDYKLKAVDLLEKNQYQKEQAERLTKNGYTVIFEFVSDHYKYQIVLPYDRERLIVTGVRHNETGQYLTHEELVEIFGEDDTVSIVQNWDWDDTTNKEGIEGYVIVFQCGLRIKLKTQWYVDRHRVKNDLMGSPRHFWEMFIKDDIDDVYLMIQNDEGLRKRFDELLVMCDEVYERIMHDGYEYYHNNGHLEAREYFPKLAQEEKDFKYFMAGHVAREMFTNEGDKSAVKKKMEQKLLVRKNISRLGMTE